LCMKVFHGSFHVKPSWRSNHAFIKNCIPQRAYRRGKDPLHEFYNDNLIWVNLETTGYNADKDLILEMACVVTTKELNTISEGPDLFIHHPDEVLSKLLPEDKKKSLERLGILHKIKRSTTNILDAEQQMQKFIFGYTTGKHNHLLAGNSIHINKLFLDKYMPAFMQKLRYRIVDVSSLKELCKRWYPTDFGKSPTKTEGSALDKIKSSIAELQYYRKVMFKAPPPPVDLKARYSGW